MKDKVVIITSASSGIGAATARARADEGCRLMLAARSEDKLRALCEDLAPLAIAVPTDVAKGDDVRKIVSTTVDHFGRVDVGFANAGIYIPGEVLEGDPDAWANLMRVDIDGVLRCVRAVLPGMVEQASGGILVTSSISGHIDIHWEPIYSASKHALQGFLHTPRRQVAAQGIRVGAIAPGMVANELWGMTTEEQIEKQIANRASLCSEDVSLEPSFSCFHNLLISPSGTS